MKAPRESRLLFPITLFLLLPIIAAWAAAPQIVGREDSTSSIRSGHPAGPGKAVKAGSGVRWGLWQSFDVSDGLPSPVIFDMLQDRAGNIWLATHFGGVSRYDGETFTTFTPEDGLADYSISSMLEDRRGNLWFATDNGVSRYDGKQFTRITTEDGLADDLVRCMLEDRHGNIWFGTANGIIRDQFRDGGKGVSRYDGEGFSDMYRDAGFRGGAYYLQLGLHWNMQTMLSHLRHESAPPGTDAARQRLEKALEEIDSWYNHLPLGDCPPLEGIADEHFEMLAHPEDGPYWWPRNMGLKLDEIDTPIFHLGGWFDVFLDSTLRSFQGIRARGRTARCRRSQRLLIGPWIHGPANVGKRQVGELDFGPQAEFDLHEHRMADYSIPPVADFASSASIQIHPSPVLLCGNARIWPILQRNVPPPAIFSIMARTLQLCGISALTRGVHLPCGFRKNRPLVQYCSCCWSSPSLRPKPVPKSWPWPIRSKGSPWTATCPTGRRT